jgi:hypothetical protein
LAIPTSLTGPQAHFERVSPSGVRRAREPETPSICTNGERPNQGSAANNPISTTGEIKAAPDAMREAARPGGGTRDRSPDGEGTRPAWSPPYAASGTGAYAEQHIFCGSQQIAPESTHFEGSRQPSAVSFQLSAIWLTADGYVESGSCATCPGIHQRFIAICFYASVKTRRKRQVIRTMASGSSEEPRTNRGKLPGGQKYASSKMAIAAGRTRLRFPRSRRREIG